MHGTSTQRRIALATALCLLFATVSALAASPGAAARPDGKGSLIVHEWGTFLSVQGSDGVTLGGMVDNDEALPAFVETRSIANWNRSRFRVKGETPVTYFYTDRPRTVQVRVDMPEGVLTHWYPNVCRFGPSPLQLPPAAPRNSFLDWCTVTLLPQSDGGVELKTEIIVTRKGEAFTGIVASETPTTVELLQSYNRGARTIEKKDIEERTIAKKQISAAALLPVGSEQTWRYVRDTDSALVKVDNFNTRDEPVVQFEKFLFYRGVGTFPMPLEIRSSEERDLGLKLHLSNRNDHGLKGLFGIRVENGRIQFARFDDLAARTNQDIALDARLTAPAPLDAGVPQIKSAVASALVGAGLYEKEAQAMVNTWDRSYFRTEGIRVLYIVPRERVDAVLPIHIKPAPDKLVRVMVGRIEVLTPTRERQIEKFVADLGANDFKAREAASTGLARLGRLGEPALRRVLATSGDPEVRARAQFLIRRSASAN
jgi:hypothetical protein